jgi:glycosyltransferase involved in cell wall biosynthesis
MKPTLVIQAPVFSLSGYGAHARDIVLALWNSQRYNISVVPTGWGGTSITDNFTPEVFDILSFVCNNPVTEGVDFAFIHVGIPLEFRRVSKINIGVTAGLESDSLPQGWADACNQMNAIIVPSEYMVKLFKAGGVTVPVYAVGEGVDTQIFHPGIEKDSIKGMEVIDFETDFNFLAGGQWIGMDMDNDRKGIGRLIRVFLEQFNDNKHVGLVLKTMISNVSSPDWAFLQQRIDAMKREKPYPKIYLIHGDLTDQEMAALYCHPKIKAYVSATSGEAWGRMTAEAAACDLPILVTGWSGHLDYLREDLCTFFDFDFAEIPASQFSQGLFGPGMRWAVPKDADVKRKMQRCVDGYTIAKERAVKLGEMFRDTWSKQRTDAKLVEIFGNVVQPPSPILTSGNLKVKPV